MVPDHKADTKDITPHGVIPTRTLAVFECL